MVLMASLFVGAIVAACVAAYCFRKQEEKLIAEAKAKTDDAIKKALGK